MDNATTTIAGYTVEAQTARSIREIREDIAAGTVPASVANFSELHDYVDANGYGGFFEDKFPIFSEDAELAEAAERMAAAVQEAVNKFIVDGGLKAEIVEAV